MSERAAAIDSGTNSTRLLIVDERGDTLVREMHITRLGQGVDATHQLRPEALERTFEVLHKFRSSMDQNGVQVARLVATSAVRDATNGQEYLAGAAEIIGVKAELLAGDEEGRLAFRGATTGLPAVTVPTLVIDIGGGSTELTTEADGKVVAFSMELGCVRLTERYLVSEPPTADEIAHAIAYIQDEFTRAEQAVPTLTGTKGGRLIGLAGTVSTLMALELRLPAYDRDRIHHATLSYQAVRGWSQILAAETPVQRLLRPGMLEGRQDVIFGGALVLERAMARYGFETCIVSESDILDGLVMSLQKG